MILYRPWLGAACLDGTLPRYWVQPATVAADSKKWAVHMQGGGWCQSLADCAHRGYSGTKGGQCLIGSSNPDCFGHGEEQLSQGLPFAEKMSLLDIPTCNGARWCGALLLSNRSQNPLAHGWNSHGRCSHSDAASYISSGILHTKYTIFGG